MARFNSAAFHRYRGAPIFRPQQATRGYRGILGRRTLGNLRSLVLFARIPGAHWYTSVGKQEA